MGVLNPTGYKKKRLKQNYHNSNIKKEDYAWCPSTVRNILKNDIYIGNVTQGKRRVKSYKVHQIEQVPEAEWIRVPNMHEPIIDQALFTKAQDLRKIDTRVQNNGEVSMWAGILKCADCMHSMHKKYCKNKSGKHYAYYICGTYRKKSNKLCSSHTIKVEELETAVLEVIQLHIQWLVDREKLIEKANQLKEKELASQSIEDSKKAKERQIEKLKNLKKGLYEDWKNENITKEEYIQYKQEYEQEIRNVEHSIHHLEMQKEKQEEKKRADNQWIKDLKHYQNITKLDRDIIMELIDYIEVHENKKLTIHFKFTKQNKEKV